ncbi:uncharacterized protein LOC124134903 [Haliotis rufescens]|uniref:uncharacterized protein LOC124134903 n=1 Tax=Haliotis rufescens TaxID=6454 RepID=UPI00201EC207|nr:uncharacterized protein LOC124134903 [Haliotis rufescens]
MLTFIPWTILAVLVHGEEVSSLHRIRNETGILSSAPDQNEAVTSQRTTSMETILSDRSAPDTITHDSAFLHKTAIVTSTKSEDDTTIAPVTPSLLPDAEKTDLNKTFGHKNTSTIQSLNVTIKEQRDNRPENSHSGTSFVSESSVGSVTEPCISKGCAYGVTKHIPLPKTVDGDPISSHHTTPTSPALSEALETYQRLLPATTEKSPTRPSVIGRIRDDRVAGGAPSTDHQGPISSTSKHSNDGGNEATTSMWLNVKADESNQKHSAESTDANRKHDDVSEGNEVSQALFEQPQTGRSHLSLTNLSILGVSLGFVVAVLVVVIVVVLKRQVKHGEKKMTSLNKETRRIDMRALRRNTINDVKASLVGIPSNGDIWLEMSKDSSIVV